LRNVIFSLVVLFGLGLGHPAAAQDAHEFFEQKCGMCHTIGGGPLLGPDLKDVTQRRDRAWLERFMQDPKAVIDGGDPVAVQLKQQANGMVMPTVPGMTPQLVRALLAYITAESRRSTAPATGRSSGNDDDARRASRRRTEAEGSRPSALPPSAQSTSQPPAAALAEPSAAPATGTPSSPEAAADSGAAESVADQPFTESDRQEGTRIFTGVQRLANGGPACSFCHTLGTVSGLGGLGGGALGPDLTLVFERFGGRRGVGAWLSSPPTPTMQAVFGTHPMTPEEILPLLAVFERASQTSHPAGATAHIRFFFMGLAGAALALVLMGWIWRGRLRSVRRSLVQAAPRGAR